MDLGIFLDGQGENVALFPCTYTWTSALQSYTSTENEDRICNFVYIDRTVQSPVQLTTFQQSKNTPHDFCGAF